VPARILLGLMPHDTPSQRPSQAEPAQATRLTKWEWNCVLDRDKYHELGSFFPEPGSIVSLSD